MSVRQFDNHIVIIILNYNNYDQTKVCVDKLIWLGVSADIVIVDNCSTNDSYDILKNKFVDFENIDVIKSEKNGGYSYGNNFGIKYAIEKNNYEYICIMNPDVILEDNCFERLCTILYENNTIAAISAMMFLNGKFDPQNLAWTIPNEKEIYQQHLILHKSKNEKLSFDVIQDSVIKTETLPGSFYIIKTSVYDEIGGLDEGTFLYNEENILGIKLRDRGYILAIDTSCHYIHNHLFVSKEKVWEKYKKNFQQVVDSYDASFQSRKYLCINYYNSKYLKRLCLVQMINMLVVHIKHMVSFFVWQDTGE